MKREVLERVEMAKRLASTMPPEEIARINELEHRRTCESYERFKSQFTKGRCYLCGAPLKTFSSTKPCIHWLLRPKGFKKKSFSLLFGEFGYFQMEAYARWVANYETPSMNINDLTDERSETKVFETTIKYRHIEWSFSCSPSDIQGHVGKASNFPHFHLQMKMDGQSFIAFNDFHIPFKDEDLWKLELMRDQNTPFEHRFMFGEGMEDVFNHVPLETLIDESMTADNESEGTFHFRTIVMAKEGEGISGETLNQLFAESKKTGQTMASLLQRLDANVSTIVAPGPGVPELVKRSGRGSKKDTP